MGKEEFFLLQDEYEILKEASDLGKQIVWFDDFAISLLHISSTKRIIKTVALPQPEIPELFPEEQEKAQRKLAELRSRWGSRTAN